MKKCKCGDVGYFVVPNYYTGEPEQEQCEFCYTNKESVFMKTCKHENPLDKWDHKECRVCGAVKPDPYWNLEGWFENLEEAKYAHEIRANSEKTRL